MPSKKFRSMHGFRGKRRNLTKGKHSGASKGNFNATSDITGTASYTDFASSENDNIAQFSHSTASISTENVNINELGSNSARISNRRVDISTTAYDGNSVCTDVNTGLSVSSEIDDYISSTANKLTKYKENAYLIDENCNAGNRIVEFEFLRNIVNSLACSNCKSNNLSLQETKRFGLASIVCITCSDCLDVKKFDTSHRLNSKTTISCYEVNRLATTAFREIGCGQAAAQSWFSVMNVPISLSKSTFSMHSKELSSAATDTADDVLKEAAKIVRQTYAKNDCISDEEIMDIAVAFDGTWHRRGHRSHYGVGIVTDLLTGLVIDYEIMSTYCFHCNANAKEKNREKHKKWLANHKNQCDKNFTGSANAMESSAAVKIWSRSVEKHKLRYTVFLGDGDSKTFHNLLEAKPYGDVIITKEECVNHISKRMGTALKNLVAQCRAEGSPISGKGKLTQEWILKLQNYYGKAIKDNRDDLNAMRNAVWAVLLHSISTDEEHHHTRCPVGEKSWCWWQRSKSSGSPPTRGHRNPLPKYIGEKLVPVFKRLGGEEILKRCLRGKTQNVNECVNSIIWQRCPKVRFAGFSTVKYAVTKGISVYNKGARASLDVADKMGISLTIHALDAAERRDRERKRKSEEQATEKTKRARKTRKLQKAKLSDKLEEEEGTTYEAGAF